KVISLPAAVDEHHGHGGSYIVGADGKRALVERTEKAEPQLGLEPAASSGESTPAAATAADVIANQPE
ncbi:MAG: hypothetical protein Q7U97_06765, partial [Rhodocyclaceae bacterium]|nr:hypothetical protein [Rhodocyclaceae bacterium]